MTMSNYPDGVTEENAPWNNPEPWEREECYTCKWCRKVKDEDFYLCTYPDLDELEYTNQENDACDSWEAE